MQSGYGIRADANTAARLLNVTGCDVADFEKNGIDLRGGSLTVNVTGNRVIGVGPTTITAQNGIVLVGPVGIIANNDLSGFDYTPAGTDACGVLVIGGGATITGNNITASETGIDVEGNLTSMGVIANNNLSGNQTGIWTDSATPLVAINNWWGSVSGPNSALNPGGNGSVASSGVNFGPWLGDGTDYDNAIGYQPHMAPVYYVPHHLVFSVEPGAGVNGVLERCGDADGRQWCGHFLGPVARPSWQLYAGGLLGLAHRARQQQQL
jgi:hypothetical protein